MLAWLRSWGPGRLVAAWVGYWIALVLVALGPAIPAIWRATHAPAGQGNVSGTWGDHGFSLVISLSGQTLWSGAISGLALTLWLALPPLLLFIVWLSQRPRRQPASMSERV
jgi:hypothetical protein